MAVDVTLTINGLKVTVPKGTLIVNAAKKAGIDIPVFCYHPKMEPVGMCRMCLVQIGRPVVDRATGKVQLEADGTPTLWFGPKLETACTTQVSEGMVVITNNEKVNEACKSIVELLLTSHPLDCPVCDKGGECPLQNLTMAHGAAESRFLFEDKQKAAKHFPLGDLIYLDRERCIQCGRCIRFQADIAGDPVLGFFNRGRKTDIVTYSEPGFDSYYSGNTTDICPVGALTTTDFRFQARAWEMKPIASICNHCAVGCNIVFDTRREAKSGGRYVIKRVMPRQNEHVNETWICDKGRFVHHYLEEESRIATPMMRKNGELVPCSWDEAVDTITKKMKEVGSRLVTLVGGRLANEDLFNLAQLTDHQNGKKLLYTYMAGGDLVARFGLEKGSDLGKLGKGDTILVAAADIQEEAPIWFLRLKQAARRGANLIVLNPRATKLDRYASHVLRYRYGEEIQAISSFLPGSNPDAAWREAVESFAEAEDAIVFYGSEGIGLDTSKRLSQVCAELLLKTRHYGRPNNGLVAAWQGGNLQGAWDMGFSPDLDLVSSIKKAGIAYLVGVNPAGDHPKYKDALETADFVVVQDLFVTESAKAAHVVLPALAYTEREGTFTSGERRLQRFYPAVVPFEGALPDFVIAARIAREFGISLEEDAPSLVLEQISKAIPAYEGMSYPVVSQVEEQWPIVGRGDLYYGGTLYENTQGMGAHLKTVGLVKSAGLPEETTITPLEIPEGMTRVVPVTKLYDQNHLVRLTPLLQDRLAQPVISLHPELARALGIDNGSASQLQINGVEVNVGVRLDKELPTDTVTVPRDVGIPISKPVVATIKKLALESKT